MMLAMKLARSASLSTCVALAMLLGACGGGGDDPTQNDEWSATAAGLNTLTIEAANADIAPNTYVLAVGYEDASGSIEIKGEIVDFVAPESPAFDTGFFYSRAQPEKFIVFFSTNDEQTFSCISQAWRTDEVVEILQFLELPFIPPCGTNISIDAALHRIRVQSLTLTALDDPSKTIRFSTRFSWQHQAQAIYATHLTVLPGNDEIPAGNYLISGREGSNDHWVGDGLAMGRSSLGTAELHLDLVYPLQSLPDRYALSVTVRATGTVFACASEKLTHAEQEAIAISLGMTALRPCPDSAQYDFTRKKLHLNNATLYNEAGTQSISINVTDFLNWSAPPIPVTSSSASLSAPGGTASVTSTGL